MLDNLSHRGTLRLIKPVGRVDLEEILKAYFLHRQLCGQNDQSIHIPGIQPGLALPEVVLLAHPLSVVQTREQNQGNEGVSRQAPFSDLYLLGSVRALSARRSLARCYAAFGGAPRGRLEATAWLGTSLNGVDGCETMALAPQSGSWAAEPAGRGETVTWRS